MRLFEPEIVEQSQLFRQYLLTMVKVLTRLTISVHPGDESSMSKNKGSRLEEETKRGRVSFDPKNFLAKVGDGKTIAKYQNDRVVFVQGDAADAVFYLQKGRVEITVVSEQGKEAVNPRDGPIFW